MLGYNPLGSSYEHFEHHNKLKNGSPEEISDELDHVYTWMQNKNFTTALGANAANQWAWVKKSMIYPPEQIISKWEEESTCNIEIVRHKLIHTASKTPSCNLCRKQLAKSIQSKIKFAMIGCECGSKWCHQSCANDFIMEIGMCCVCKKYFNLSLLNTTLRSTVLYRV
jgi:hypothetical protein